jgi:hypothetical protein
MEGPQRKHLFQNVPVYISSVTAGNKRVSNEVNICYRGLMPQHAIYQGSSLFVNVRIAVQKHDILECRSRHPAVYKAWALFGCRNTEIVGSNPTPGIDVIAHFFCICLVLCVSRGFAWEWSRVQGELPNVYCIRNCEGGRCTKMGCGVISRVMIR